MARKLKHPYIGTEHLLLGLRSEITGVAGQVLASHGVDEEQLLHLMDELIVPGEEILQQDDPKESPRLEYILENAKKEALHLRTGDVGTEHLLLAIMHDADCVAARMLITLNINLQKILQDVLNAAGVDAKEYQEEIQEDGRTRRGAVDQYCTDLTAEAAEGKLELTADKQHLFLHLYNGEQFENLKSQSVISRNVPYRRETFKEKHTLIAFDTNFEMVDGNFLNQRSDIKNMNEISLAIDSLNMYADSVGRAMYSDAMKTAYRKPVLTKTDSTKIEKEHLAIINTDSILNGMTSAQKLKTLNSTETRLSSLMSDWSMKSYMTREADNNIRRHQSDWHKKITLSLACIIFFFIGAPLGAIIRKGGLGMPVVISVLIFVLYYIIDSGATRVAKSGEMNIILGTWMSTIILAPLGGFLTYKSNKDSVVFNIDVYVNFFRKLFGIRVSRHVFKKEVIIHTPDYTRIYQDLDKLCQECETYGANHKLLGPPNYYQVFTNNKHDDAIKEISLQMEGLVEEMSNTKDGVLLNLLNNYPFLSVKAHKSVSDNRWLNLLIGIIVPAGLLIWLNIWRYRVRLDKDLKTIVKNSRDIQERIKKTF